jgi:hypothetical protein
MPDNYLISLSRTPDGHLIVTTDPTVPLAHECVAAHLGGKEASVFIRLDIVYKGKAFPVWYCDSEAQADEAAWEKIIEARKPEIIEALKQRELRAIQK